MKTFLFILFLCFFQTISAQYGKLRVNAGKYVGGNLKVYHNDSLIFNYKNTNLDGLVIDSLIPSKNYYLDITISPRKDSLNFTREYFSIEKDSVRIIYFELRISSYIENLSPKIAYENSNDNGFETSLIYVNRNWKGNETEQLSCYGFGMAGVVRMNMNAYVGGVFTFGGTFLYGQRKNQTVSIQGNSYDNSVQNLQQLVFTSTANLRFQIPAKPEKYDANDLVSLQLGVGYNLPLINKYTVYNNYNSLLKERYFHKYTDVFLQARMQISVFGFFAEYHPFDVFWKSLPEVSKLRVGVAFQFLDW